MVQPLADFMGLAIVDAPSQLRIDFNNCTNARINGWCNRSAGLYLRGRQKAMPGCYRRNGRCHSSPAIDTR